MLKFNVLSWTFPAWIFIFLAVIDYSSCASLPPEGFELCREDQFTCKNGHCIPISYLCDKDFDCDDGSDEKICAVGCQLPLKIEHGRVKYENPEDRKVLDTAPDNYVLQFRCNKGYDLSGPKTLFCIKGEWSDKFPLCLSLHCGAPPVIGNGTYQVIKGVSRRPIIGSKTTYSCIKGFELENEDVNQLTCKLNGTSATWTGELPVCREMEVCRDPGVSPDGKRAGNCCYKGDILKFSCNRGYELVGQREIECLAGGSWSGPRARCKPPGVTCSDPPEIPNGLVQSYSASDFVQPEEDIMIKCNDGYSFRGGQDVLYCDDEGLWDDEFGRCEVVPCKFPEIPLNGTIVQLKDTNATEFPDGFYLSYACDNGFRLIGFSWNTCYKSRWRFEIPKCEVIRCSDPGTPDNGVREGNNFDVGSKVTYSCFSGYAILGSVERYCLSNGQWSGEIARCNSENNYCPDPGIPVNGMKTGSVYDEGSIIEYRCNPGFSLLGNDTRICQSNHVWSGDEPKCLGAYDFDNNAEVSIALQAIVETQVEAQEEELIKYEETLKALLRNRGLNFSSIGEMELAIMRSRTLDLNYPGRIVLYFIFDASGSVGSEHFKTSVEFAKALVKKVGISEAGARAGALSFSSTASVHFMPFELSTTEAVLAALDEIEYTSGGTAISVAFEKVQTDMIPTSKAILGPNQKSVIFILTDGKANMGGDPEILADALKTEAGVEIYCIGITGSTAVQSLYRIASKPKTPEDEHVFILDNYGTLSWLIQKITNGSIDYSECGVGLEQVAKRHGREKRSDRGRIIGGLKAVEPWPWMAALYFTSKDRPNQPMLQCGGSIIAKQWILTAAHCLVDKNDNNKVRERDQVIVRLGLTSLKNETNLVEFEPLEIIIHQQYEPITLDYDMALLKLDRIIEFNAYVRPICLPPKELPPDTTLYKPNERAFVAGWGHDKKRGEKEKAIFKTVDHLKELVLPIKSEEACKNSLIGRPNIYVFTDRMFCAGSGLGEVDTCQGDSGGPMMQSQASVEKNVYWVQMGVVSWGIGCGQMNTYGYYTHVQHLRDWIDKKINPS